MRKFLPLLILIIFSAANAAGQNLSASDIELQAARLKSTDAEMRRDALHKLRASESAAASRIALAGLRDNSEIVRATAPFAVLSLPSAEAAQSLLPQLNDKSELVRRETAYALGKTRETLAARPLIELLRSDKQFSVKCAAAVALGEIGDLSAVNDLNAVLQKNVKAEDEFLRRATARSLGQIADATLSRQFFAQTEQQNFNSFALKNRRHLIASFPILQSSLLVLIRVLENLNEADDVRREAASALGAFGDARALSILQANFSAPDYYLSQIAKNAFRQINETINYGR